MKSELWTRYKDNQKKGTIKSQLCFPWRGFRFVWWTRWGCGWEEVGHRLRPDLMPIQAKKSVMIDTTTWIEITRRRQIRFKSVRNHKQESKTPFNSPVPKSPFFSSLHAFCYPESPSHTAKKQSKVWTGDAFLNYFSGSTTHNNTQQRNYEIFFRKGYEVQFWAGSVCQACFTPTYRTEDLDPRCGLPSKISWATRPHHIAAVLW